MNAIRLVVLYISVGFALCVRWRQRSLVAILDRGRSDDGTRVKS